MECENLERRGNYCSLHHSCALLLASTLNRCSAAIHALPKAEIEKRVDALLAKMTLDEKKLTLSAAPMTSTSRRFRGSVYPRFASPTVRWECTITTDNGYPAGIDIGRFLGRRSCPPRRRNDGQGRLERAGVPFRPAPGMNIYRAPMNGRNFRIPGRRPFPRSRMGSFAD